MEGKSAPPEKILDTRTRKGPRLTLVWGPRMLNPALRGTTVSVTTRHQILVHAFVASRVDYCNCVLSSAPKKVMDKLQHVPNAAARLVTGTRKKYERGLSRLMHDDLHCLVIPQRVQYVQARCDSPSLSSAPSSMVPRQLLCASLRSSWPRASAICQMSSTVSSTSSPHFRDPCFFCSRTNSLEFTA